MPAPRKYPVPAGLKPVRRKLATGEVRTYWYHRATGERLESDPTTATGFIEIEALDKKGAALVAVAGHRAGSFAALWADYRGDPTTDAKEDCGSPEWRALKPRTRSDYQAVRDWIGEAAERAIVRHMTSDQITRLRDKAFTERGRRFANYVVQVIHLVLEWGRSRGWLKLKNGLTAENPAKGVKKVKRPKGARRVHRAWTPDEIESFARSAPPQLLVVFALGLFAGMREGDAISVTWSAYKRGELSWIAGKNGEECSAPVTGGLLTALEWAKSMRGTAVQIAVTSRGTPWTESGFRASFFKLLGKLKAAGAIKPGCTFHGLRYTVGKVARDDNQSDSRVAAAIGDKTTAMAAIYGRDADKLTAQGQVLGDLQKRFANIDWKTGLENASIKARGSARPKGRGR